MGTAQNGTDLLKLNYEYGATAAVNNGNVTKQTIAVPTVGANTGFTAVQSYTYDEPNRLKDAVENVTPVGGSASQSWRQAFTFDRYGNRNFDEENSTTLPKNCGTAPNLVVCEADRKVVNPSADASNNRFSAGQGYVYDAAGNTIADANGQTYIYDAENKMVMASNASGTLGQYTYDGDGKRIKKFVPSAGETTVFAYDASSKMVAEYSTVIASTNDAKVSYLTNDNLGSPRINTDALGNVTARHDYMPFGEEIDGTGGRTTALKYGTDSVRKQFTGYERDNEINLDFAEARMYGSAFGRFTSPDPLLSSGRVENPQTWNRYGYTLNLPTSNVDPHGLYICTSKDKDFCASFDAALEKGRSNLSKIEEKYGKNSRQYEKAARALDVYGEKGVDNGVLVRGKNGLYSGRTMVQGFASKKTSDNPSGQRILVEFDINMKDNGGFSNLIGHEGSHAADGSDWVASGFKASANPSMYQTEMTAYTVSGILAEASGFSSWVVPTNIPKSIMKNSLDRILAWPYSAEIWNSSWAAVDVDKLRTVNIEHHLQYDENYQMTATNKNGVASAFTKGGRIPW